MTRLSELKPRMQQASSGAIDLSFDCPLCGVPYRVCIRANVNGRTPALNGIPVWQVTVPEPPNFSWDAVTVSPSINNTPGGHGRKKPCTWHGHIINGEVTSV